MEDKKMKDFSLTALFLVTGLSFFIFSKALLFIDGTRLPAFTWIGIIAILAGSLNGLRTSTERTGEK